MRVIPYKKTKKCFRFGQRFLSPWEVPRGSPSGNPSESPWEQPDVPENFCLNLHSELLRDFLGIPEGLLRDSLGTSQGLLSGSNLWGNEGFPCCVQLRIINIINDGDDFMSVFSLRLDHCHQIRFSSNVISVPLSCGKGGGEMSQYG